MNTQLSIKSHATRKSALIATITALLFTTTLTPVYSDTAKNKTALERIGIKNPDTNSEARDNRRITPEISKQFLADEAEITRQEIIQQFCDQPPTDQLCATIPMDNTDFDELFVYMFISAAAQNSFDVFSWQTFIGLNWSTDQQGQSSQNIHNNAGQLPPRWLNYKTPQQLFNPTYQEPICQQARTKNADQVFLQTDNFKQTGGLPLIDKNLNYTVYDVRINNELADYITTNNLDTVTGQFIYKDSGQEIDFPVGRYDDPENKTGGSPGSIAIKSAWKVIDPSSGDDPENFYTIKGLIPVSAKDSENGQAFCIEIKLGLVGMHIMRRIESGNGLEWTWSTFEHTNNAPLASNSRTLVDTLHNDLFKGECLAPENLDAEYSFYNPSHPNQPTNKLNSTQWKWATKMPYAEPSAKQVGTQVVRCWENFEGTAFINNIWQEKLKDTVWSNYKSTSAQWKGANKGMMFPEGEVPRFLTNTTMETYSQYDNDSSCLSCHAKAKSLAGQDAKFSFLLSLVARYQPTEKIVND